MVCAGVGRRWHWAHNPKVAGSNPAPAILIRALETMPSRAFISCFFASQSAKNPVLAPFWLHLVLQSIDYMRDTLMVYFGRVPGACGKFRWTCPEPVASCEPAGLGLSNQDARA
jgi:hypothetical protein